MMVSAVDPSSSSLPSRIQLIIKELGFEAPSDLQACNKLVNRVINENLVNLETWNRAIQKVDSICTADIDSSLQES